MTDGLEPLSQQEMAFLKMKLSETEEKLAEAG